MLLAGTPLIKTNHTPAMTPFAPVQLVIFGLTGDLARKKLLPALYQLVADGLLTPPSRVIGVTRRDVSVAEVLAPLHDHPGYAPEHLKQLEAMIEMFQMDLTQASDYQRLKTHLDRTEEVAGQCSHRLLYLSMPPQVFAPVIDLLGAAGLNAGCPHGSGHSRLLIEKPFGYSLASAEELVERIAAQFDEEQIFRIDHYLAKETSQNILAFRQQNPLFHAVWDGRYVDRITVTASETIGIEGRLFYDQTGALRDLLQNHLLQLLALVTMEMPPRPDADHLHTEKLRLLRSIPSITADQVASHTIRGQYDGYRDEVGHPASTTETFAAVRLAINSPRWHHVPIIVQTGKALSEKATEIVLEFKDPQARQPFRNNLTIRVEPDEGICLDLRVKKPGLGTEVETADMDFRYARSFNLRHPDAYERVLADAIRGDRTLFTTSDEILESWRIVDAIVQEWNKSDAGLITYKPGTPAYELSVGIQPTKR
jgi:glucose-6-phosphate 1-dehydrogenase